MNATGEHHQHFFKNKRLTLFALIPFILYTLIMISAGLGGLGDIAWFIAIPSMLSLLISGIGIVANHKRWNLLAWISITLFSIGYGIMGYYDYIQWFSTKVALVLLVFFITLTVIKRFSNKH